MRVLKLRIFLDAFEKAGPGKSEPGLTVAYHARKCVSDLLWGWVGGWVVGGSCFNYERATRSLMYLLIICVYWLLIRKLWFGKEHNFKIDFTTFTQVQCSNILITS